VGVTDRSLDDPAQQHSGTFEGSRRQRFDQVMKLSLGHSQIVAPMEASPSTQLRTAPRAPSRRQPPPDPANRGGRLAYAFAASRKLPRKLAIGERRGRLALRLIRLRRCCGLDLGLVVREQRGVEDVERFAVSGHRPRPLFDHEYFEVVR
jgi:hypothetical protein